MIDLGVRGGWQPPVLKTVASRHEGLTELVAEIDRHRAWLDESGERKARRLRRTQDEISALVLGAVRQRLAADQEQLSNAAQSVLDGTTDSYSAAANILEQL